MSTGHIIPGRDPSREPPASAGGGRPAPPEPSHAERARTLVAGHSRGALSTLAVVPAGTPFGSVVTYGLDPVGQPFFFVSTMAEHTHNLDADPRASLLVVEDIPAGADPLMPAALRIISHMNEDHADALVTLCHHDAGRGDVVSAAMTAVDRYGFEVVAHLGADRREALRIGFRTEQTTADGVRRELIGLLDQARS